MIQEAVQAAAEIAAKPMNMQIKRFNLNDIKQTQISDTANVKLCTALCDIVAAGIIQGKTFDLAQINAIIDESIRNGGLATVDHVNSWNGFVTSHEKIAEAAGLRNVKKIYRQYQPTEIIDLLKAGTPVELRHENHHSMLAYGYYLKNGEVMVNVFDPWPPTNDTFYSLSKRMTGHLDAGQKTYVYDRPIELIGYYENV